MSAINNNIDNKIIESLDGSELPTSSSPVSDQKQDDGSILRFPILETSSDFEAVYHRRCAEKELRTQPSGIPLKDAKEMIIGKKIELIFPSDDPDDPEAPGPRLRQLTLLENAKPDEAIQLTNYPCMKELIELVAGYRDLPKGYNPWFALFTAVYLALPISILDRLCEDLIWSIGDDKDTLHTLFKVYEGYFTNYSYDYSKISFRIEPAFPHLLNTQYLTIAHGALKEYLQRNALLDCSKDSNSDALNFTSYQLSLRFNASTFGNIDENGDRFHVRTSEFVNGNPRMLHHILTKQTVKVDTWPSEHFGSAEDAAIFAEMLCAYINSKSAWSAELIESIFETLVNLASVAPYFEFANILLSNLLGCGIRVAFDSIRLLTAAAKHSKESFLAWRKFVKRAAVFDNLDCPIDLSQITSNAVELHCALLEHNLLHYVTDGTLQEFMLCNLQQPIKNGSSVLSVAEIIAKVFIEDRIADIQRLHRLGLDVGYLRNNLKNIKCNFIPTLQFAEEQEWLETGSVEYRGACMENLLTHDALDAARWLYVKHPDTGATMWSMFKERVFSPKHLQCCTYKDVSCGCKLKKKRYGKFIRWMLLENRDKWKNPVTEDLVSDFIRSGDYQTLCRFYAIAGVKPSKKHAKLALSLPSHLWEHVQCWRLVQVRLSDITHVMFLVLRCILDALHANGKHLNLHEFLCTAGNSIDGATLDWMMRRGFFATKSKIAKKRIATRNTQHATRNTQHATRNTQHATRNTQHATRNTQHATFL
jgi:hypothetical protein